MIVFKFSSRHHFGIYDVNALPSCFTGVTIQHSVDVVRLLIFSYMKYKSHLTFFFFKLKKVSMIGFEPGQSDYRAGTLSTRPPTTSCKKP